jgi:hypothetical protein
MMAPALWQVFSAANLLVLLFEGRLSTQQLGLWSLHVTAVSLASVATLILDSRMASGYHMLSEFCNLSSPV